MLTEYVIMYRDETLKIMKTKTIREYENCKAIPSSVRIKRFRRSMLAN